MDEDDLVTSADETVSMGSTDTDSSLYWQDPGREYTKASICPYATLATTLG